MTLNNKRICIIIVVLSLVILLPSAFIAHAQQNAEVLQGYVDEQMLTVFTDKEFSTDSLKCSVSNQDSEIIAAGLLSENNVLIRKTVLIDISTSIPKTTREGVLETLRKMVENKEENEELRIIVFGEELETLQEFSSDRYELANAVENIVFNGAQSKIYDAVFNTIPRITRFDDNPVFYYTVVITDGVDDTLSGITKEELFIKLQNERYPVDVVAVSNKEVSENKELAAIARMSGGRYNSLNPNTNPATLSDALEIGNYFYFEALIPSALLDGTIRQVDITDGINAVSMDVKFPVFNISDTTKPEEPSPAVTMPTETPDAQVPPQMGETTESKSISDILSEYKIVVFVSIALIIVFIIVLVIVITRSKKNKTMARPVLDEGTDYRTDISVDKTEFVGNVDYSDSQFTIKLRNVADPTETWELPVTCELLIGRAKHCRVQLDDKSVSREQCKIIVSGDSLVIVHTGMTNKTYLNGTAVIENTPIQTGDTLKFGRVSLCIEYVQSPRSSPPELEIPQNKGGGNTELLL